MKEMIKHIYLRFFSVVHILLVPNKHHFLFDGSDIKKYDIMEIDRLISVAKNYIDECNIIKKIIQIDHNELIKFFFSNNNIMNQFVPYKKEDGGYVEYEEDLSIRGTYHQRRIIRDVESLSSIKKYKIYDSSNDIYDVDLIKEISDICVYRCNYVINVSTQFINLMIYYKNKFYNNPMDIEDSEYIKTLFDNLYNTIRNE